MDVIKALCDNNPDLVVIDIPLYTEEWYEFRLNGIGASETGYVLRKSDWKDSLPVYEEKTGLKTVSFSLNEAMTSGTYLEGNIANLWRYFDITGKTTWWDNLNKGIVKRECETEQIKDRYFVNKKYPWLFCSLDGIILAEKLGVLEIKNQKSVVLNKWTLKVPPEQLYQITQIMLILGLDYGEICCFVDGSHLQVTEIPLPLIEELADDLISETKKFWFENVLPAKKLKSEKEKAYLDGDKEKAMELEAKLFDYEPAPIGTKAYVDYLSESALVEMVEIVEDERIYERAIKMKKIAACIKELEAMKLEHEAVIRHHFRVKEGNEMDFGEFGSIKIKPRGKSEKTVLYNNVKDEKSKEEIIEIAQKEVSKIKI